MKKFSPKWILYGLLLVLAVMVLAKVKRLMAPGGLVASLTGDTESRRQHEQSKKMVDGSKVTGKVTKTPEQIRQAADLQHQAFLNVASFGGMKNFGTDENLLFSSLSGFDVGDLQGVYKAFGVREDFLFGLPVFTGNLIDWYNAELSGNDLERMKMIWKDTGRW